MIAVDAMGGDRAPETVVHGALRAAQSGIPIYLFGQKDLIIQILNTADPCWQKLPITIEHCTQVIGMDEEPSRAVINKKDASLVRAMHAVKEGRAQAFVSAGNSGAVLVSSMLILGRVSGILRPAIGGFLPTYKGSVFCLDLGANADCKPAFLEQFAIMGHVYVRLVKNITAPRIVLLSNGHESYKGSTIVKEAYARLVKSELNFVGNLEARDIFNDTADVIICDGFSGNILLKSIQGTARTLLRWLKDEASNASLIRKFLLWINASILKKIKTKTDPATCGGALLLGVIQPVVLAHGNSSTQAIKSAIEFSYQVVQKNIISLFNQQLEMTLRKQTKIPERVRSLFAWGQKQS